MKYNPDIHDRKSTRLHGYDYSAGGVYFVTICTHERQCILDTPGLYDIAHAVWEDLPARFQRVKIDAFVVMPNHIHAIFNITPRVISPVGNGDVGAVHEPPQKGARPILSKIVGYFKMNTARRINVMRGASGTPVWQRGFFDRIIRNDEELYRIREYIHRNPDNWDRDRENPNRVIDDDL